MNIRLYQVDAFTDRLFGGNPAAVCPLDSWPPDETMQQIAAENNLSETAFYLRTGDRFRIRWFTPAVEVDLCGHATLASAYVIFRFDGYAGDRITLDSNSGPLAVRREGELLVLDFPADPPSPVTAPAGLAAAVGREPVETLKGKTDYLLVYPAEEDVAAIAPDFVALGRVEARGIVVTAPGRGVDFVSRFFGPRVGVPEDPVTGSAHTMLTPYWSKRVGKPVLEARQLSKRLCRLRCRMAGDRVEIAGTAVPYLSGTLTV
jgi:PhzF family phenazine biosynthesis protein